MDQAGGAGRACGYAGHAVGQALSAGRLVVVVEALQAAAGAGGCQKAVGVAGAGQTVVGSSPDAELAGEVAHQAGSPAQVVLVLAAAAASGRGASGTPQRTFRTDGVHTVVVTIQAVAGACA